MWRKLSSKIIFKHPQLVVKEDTVQIQSGKIIKYLRYSYKGDGVVILAHNAKDQLLFIQEYSYVLKRRILQLPMGKIEKGELPEIAANRELREETGLKAAKRSVIGSYFQNHRRSKNKGYVVVATKLSTSPLKPDEEEQAIKKVWVSIGDIAKLIAKGEIADTDSLTSLRIRGL